MKSIWQQRAEALYDLLDDIDTAADVCKGNHEAYRQMVDGIARMRHRYATIRGDTIKWADPPPPKFDLYPGDGDVGTLAERTYSGVVGGRDA